MRQVYFITTVIFVFFMKPHFSQTNLSGTLSCNTLLPLSGSPYYVLSNLIVPPGCVLTAEPGIEIRMSENTHLIIKGKVNFSGTSSLPIHIHAKDTIWGNILLDSTLMQKSTFNNVIIENARKSLKTLQEPGAIYGYFSSFELKNCQFKKNLRCVSAYQCPDFLIEDCVMDSTNKGEKIHGQYCDGAIVDGTILYPTRGDCDAMDFDASKNVFITNNYIYGGDDDGIDIGQCDSIGCDTVTVVGNFILNMANKGISNGEYCKNINIHHNVIAGCGLGVGAKSGAVVKADHNTLYGNRLGLRSYEHLSQTWGPGNLTVSNCIIANSDTTWSVDPTAFLSVSYSLSNDTLIPGTGNIKGNPAFISPALTATANFHLNANSAAINSGDPSFPLDPDGSRTDMGAFFANISAVQAISLSNGLSVFPNPTKGIFQITLSDNNIVGNTDGMQVKVFNSTGQIVYCEVILPRYLTGKHIIDLSKQTEGVYYLQIMSGQRIATSKLIVN